MHSVEQEVEWLYAFDVHWFEQRVTRDVWSVMWGGYSEACSGFRLETGAV